MKASKIIGSQVLALDSARICGTVCDICLSAGYRRVVALEILFSEEENSDEKGFVPYARIIRPVNDAITVKYERYIQPTYTFPLFSPINLDAYGENGEYYGRICDLETDDKFNITKIITGSMSFTPHDILTFGTSLITFRASGSKTKITRSKSKTNVMPDLINRTPTMRYDFLLGKTVNALVLSNGITIAEKGDIIDRDILNRARGSGCLVKLAIASL